MRAQRRSDLLGVERNKARSAPRRFISASIDLTGIHAEEISARRAGAICKRFMKPDRAPDLSFTMCRIADLRAAWERDITAEF